MRRLVRGWVTSAGLLGALALASGGVALSLPESGPVEAATASFTVSPPSQTVSEGSGPVTVDVMLNDAAGVSAWEFRLTYNADVLDLETATADQSFLSSLPGQFCPGAIKNEDDGWVLIGCATSQENDGASGTARLATITFTPKSSGKSNLIFTKAVLSNDVVYSNINIPATAGTGVIKVTDGGDNSVDPTPTVNPSLLTPTNPQGTPPAEVDPNDPNVTGDSSAKTPTPRSGTTSSGSGSSGSGSGSSSSGGSVQGSTTSGGAGSPSSGASGSGSSGSATGPDGAPVAGAGTLEEQAAWPRYLLVLTGIAGVALVAGGAAMSRGRKDVA